MEGFERVDFDFSGEGGLAAIRQLEDILSSGHWSDRPLDYNDERTMLLLRLIRFGDIVVYKREFTYQHLAEDMNTAPVVLPSFLFVPVLI